MWWEKTNLNLASLFLSVSLNQSYCCWPMVQPHWSVVTASSFCSPATAPVYGLIGVYSNSSMTTNRASPHVKA